MLAAARPRQLTEQGDLKLAERAVNCLLYSRARATLNRHSVQAPSKSSCDI